LQENVLNYLVQYYQIIQLPYQILLQILNFVILMDDMYIFLFICSYTSNSLQFLKNYFVFIFKLELKIDNLELDLHFLIWKNNIILVVEMYYLFLFLDFENTFSN
jgi:hypothetical protein